jgi:hypothetical protein
MATIDKSRPFISTLYTICKQNKPTHKGKWKSKNAFWMDAHPHKPARTNKFGLNTQ